MGILADAGTFETRVHRTRIVDNMVSIARWRKDDVLNPEVGCMDELLLQGL